MPTLDLETVRQALDQIGLGYIGIFLRTAERIRMDEGEMVEVAEVVDDHPEVRSTTAAVLEDSGHAVVEADNGTEALTLLKERKCDFDVVITDYAMPHLSGTDFLREARLLCPDIPALLITGYAETEMIRDRPAGVETLLKPFTPAKLEAAMGRVCGAKAVAS